MNGTFLNRLDRDTYRDFRRLEANSCKAISQARSYNIQAGNRRRQPTSLRMPVRRKPVLVEVAAIQKLRSERRSFDEVLQLTGYSVGTIFRPVRHAYTSGIRGKDISAHCVYPLKVNIRSQQPGCWHFRAHCGWPLPTLLLGWRRNRPAIIRPRALCPLERYQAVPYRICLIVIGMLPVRGSSSTFETAQCVC